MVGEDEGTINEGAVALEEMFAAAAAPDEPPVETPGVFLTGVSTALKASDDVDADLAAILSDHLLTGAPQANAVLDAKAAIMALAAKRAVPAGDKVDG